MKNILTFLFLISFAFAEDIKLTGKIVDQNNAPIEGIEVELKSNGLKGVTNSDGEWEINGTASSINVLTPLNSFEYQLVGKSLLFSQNEENFVQVQIVDASGKTHLSQKLNFSGEKSLDLQDLSNDVFYVQIQTSKEHYNFQLILNQQQNKLVSNPKTFAASKITDSLVYKLQGQIFSEDEITEYQDHINKYLKVRDVTGSIKVDPQNRTTIKKVYAHFSGGKMKEPVVLELGWLSQTNKFSGQIYSVKPPAGTVFDYQAFVYGVDSLGHKTTQTITLEFNSVVGPLEMPDVIAGNALPYGKISSPDGFPINGGYTGRSLELFADVKDSLRGKIVKFEWDLGTGKFSEATANVSMKKDQMGVHLVRMRATDDDGNILEISQNIGFNDLVDGEIVDARDQKRYALTTIGNLTWMAENLAYLPQVDDVTDGSEKDGQSDKPFYYVMNYSPQGNTEADEVAAAKQTENFQKYGVLYNWNAAKDACPLGWRIPTEDDWESMMLVLASEDSRFVKSSNRWGDITSLRIFDWGNEQKKSFNSIETYHGNDLYNFHAAPGGVRDVGNSSVFRWESTMGYWWSNTKKSEINMNSWHMDLLNIYNNPASKNYGMSIRCVSEAGPRYFRYHNRIETNFIEHYKVYADFKVFGDTIIDQSNLNHQWKVNGGEWLSSTHGTDTLNVTNSVVGINEVILKTVVSDTVLMDTLKFEKK